MALKQYKPNTPGQRGLVLVDKSDLYKGKPRGYYDPSPEEIFMTELGQEIFKFTDEHQHKSQMITLLLNNHFILIMMVN